MSAIQSDKPASLSTTMPSTASLPIRTKRAWPWRKHITPVDLLLAHQYAGKGTEESPYILDWLPGEATYGSDGSEGLERAVDVEYPQTWKSGYKWGITALGAISVLSVTMTSSMMSAAIYDIRKDFPGHTAEMYIMGK